ncbi:NAD-binding protein [Micropruina sonneratiae]|uniref:NAD-binding protein n=1 Tax=Micropruina sonneratiae TaxID=2986940 RepID=UPI002226CB7E|nr:NAD-binding protein [Micropruina sp. KQZ13P-5]MCW3158963.1 NAD-binding protein [Micropruina sp. KQZ13P-5]
MLEPLARHVEHFGGVGTGTAYKLIVNLMGAVQLAGAAEGLAMAQRAGLDLTQVVRVLATGQAASPQVVRNAQRMVAGDHDQRVTFPAGCAAMTPTTPYGWPTRSTSASRWARWRWPDWTPCWRPDSARPTRVR